MVQKSFANIEINATHTKLILKQKSCTFTINHVEEYKGT